MPTPPPDPIDLAPAGGPDAEPRRGPAPLRVHVLGEAPPPAAAAALETAAAGLVRWTAGPDVPGDAGGVRVVVAGRVSEAAFEAFTRLEAIVVPFAGLPAETRTQCLARPELRVHNLHHNAAITAEAAVGLLLAAARRLVPCDASLRRGDWGPSYDGVPAMRLAGRRACVLGYGAIGRRVARALAALELDVTAVRRRRPEPSDPSGRGEASGVRVVGADATDEAVAGAAVLMVCLPATPETEGRVDGAMLDRLAVPAVVVNVGRGPIVVEADLYDRLENGRLFGAGLDTWWRYPASDSAADRASTPPGRCDWGGLESVVLSPHRAGAESPPAGLVRRYAALGELLAAMAAGDTDRQRVDPQRGY